MNATNRFDRATIAVREIDLGSGIEPLGDIQSYAQVRLFVRWNAQLLGHIDIVNHYRPVAAAHLRDLIAERFALKILALGAGAQAQVASAHALSALAKHLACPKTPATLPELQPLPAHIAVSVVVPSYDRPADLRTCLRSLTQQVSPRQIEIIVVDNNPSSGLTPPVVNEFAGITLVSEARKGLSYAHHAGFCASSGKIIATITDMTQAPPDWIEKLVAPFVRADVMVVTGNILPLELTTDAQRLAERYLGLGCSSEGFEVNGDWFEKYKRRAVPTWDLGSSANAAFRSLLLNPGQRGLIEAMPGPETLQDSARELYLFYKVLKAGYTIIYDPRAYVWHRYEADAQIVHERIYNRALAQVTYHVTTLLRDHDLRACVHLLYSLPKTQMRRLRDRLLRRSSYPAELIWLEIKGSLHIRLKEGYK